MAKQKPTNEIDLEKELDQETESTQTGSDFEPDLGPAPSADDFDMDEDWPVEDEPEPTQQDQSRFTPDYLRKTANRWVRAFDSLQRALIRPLYKKTILHEGDEAKAKAWTRKYEETGGKMQDIIAGDWETKERLDRYTKAMESLPLSDDEREAIAEPLSELIEKYKHLQMSPEWALVFAVAIVMLPRLEPVFPSIRDLFKGKG